MHNPVITPYVYINPLWFPHNKDPPPPQYTLTKTFFYQQVIDRYTQVDMDIRLYTLMIVVIIYPAGIVSPLKHLVPFSAIANAVLLFSLGLIFCEIFRDLPNLSSRPFVQNADQWPIFLGTSFVCMEGIGVVSIRDRIYLEKSRPKLNKILPFLVT